MNKTELVAAMADASGLSKTDADSAYQAFVETVTDALKKEETVTLIGFGTFTVRERAARTGRNPQTGADIEIKAANVPAFVSGKALKEAVNK